MTVLEFYPNFINDLFQVHSAEKNDNYYPSDL